MARLTYINLLNGYYLLRLPSRLGIRASHLFLSLLHEANQTGFPEILHIPNSIAQGICGMGSPSSLFRAREKLVDFQHNQENLLTYLPSSNVHECGSYLINYQLLLDALPSWLHNDNENGNKNHYPLTDRPVSSNMTTKPKSTDNETEVKPTTYIDKIRQDEKDTTTTESATSQVTGSSSENASQIGTEAPDGISNDITILKGVIMMKKWPSVTTEPSYTACRRMIEEAGGDVNVVVEAIGRMSITLKYEQNGDDVAGAIMAYVKNKHYGRSKEAEATKAPLTAQQQLDKARQELEHFTGDPRYEKSASEQYAINYVKTVKGEIARLEREVKNAE